MSPCTYQDEELATVVRRPCFRLQPLDVQRKVVNSGGSRPPNFVRDPGYDLVFENAGLAEALHAHLSTWRPLFDDGLHLFPSVHGKAGAITSGQLGRLTGSLTFREFGVRIPIHRFRDNVGTEASENLIGSAYVAKTLLRHVDEATTLQHYNQAEGVKSAGEFGDFIETRRTVSVELIL